jgi:hypothetical protein
VERLDDDCFYICGAVSVSRMFDFLLALLTTIYYPEPQLVEKGMETELGISFASFKRVHRLSLWWVRRDISDYRCRGLKESFFDCFCRNIVI